MKPCYGPEKSLSFFGLNVRFQTSERWLKFTERTKCQLGKVHDP
jgi:hypothetical protein